MAGVPLQPMARTSVSQSIASAIRRSILNGELGAGTRLRAVHLARAFDVSNTPVREALQELSLEGLVDLDRHRSGVVTTIGEDDVLEVERIRKALEPILLKESIALARPEALASAESIASEIGRTASWDDWIRGERLFHARLLEGVRSQRMASIVSRLRDLTITFISSTGRDTSGLRAAAERDHEGMLAALRSRDLEALVASSRDHPPLCEMLGSGELLSSHPDRVTPVNR